MANAEGWQNMKTAQLIRSVEELLRTGSSRSSAAVHDAHNAKRALISRIMLANKLRDEALRDGFEYSANLCARASSTMRSLLTSLTDKYIGSHNTSYHAYDN